MLGLLWDCFWYPAVECLQVLQSGRKWDAVVESRLKRKYGCESQTHGETVPLLKVIEKNV